MSPQEEARALAANVARAFEKRHNIPVVGVVVPWTKKGDSYWPSRDSIFLEDKATGELKSVMVEYQDAEWLKRPRVLVEVE